MQEQEKNLATSVLEAVQSKTDLPLVLEIMPGQATEGIMSLYEPESYKGKNLDELVKSALNKDLSIEEQQIADKIKEQMVGGKLLYKGNEVQSNPLDYAVVEKTGEGEKYFYVQLRAIKPQEGGFYK